MTAINIIERMRERTRTCGNDLIYVQRTILYHVYLSGFELSNVCSVLGVSRLCLGFIYISWWLFYDSLTFLYHKGEKAIAIFCTLLLWTTMKILPLRFWSYSNQVSMAYCRYNISGSADTLSEHNGCWSFSDDSRESGYSIE